MEIDRTEFHAPHSPQTQAHWDQLHARSLDELRQAETFVLVTLRERDDGRPETFLAGTTCRSRYHGSVVMTMLLNNLESLCRTLTLAGEYGADSPIEEQT